MYINEILHIYLLCILLYNSQYLIDYEISSPNENFLNNERFWVVAETDTGSRKVI